MSGGILGGFDGEGWTESDIPDASDDSEVYPKGSRVCTGASVECEGPKGIVTWFEGDPSTAESRIEYGTPTVSVEGSEVCVVIPRWQVTSVTGTKHYYNWYDCCCVQAFVSWDCWVEVEKVKSEQGQVEEDRTLLEPLIRCRTDWTKKAIDLFIEGLKAGAGAALSRSNMEEVMSAVESGTFARLNQRAASASAKGGCGCATGSPVPAKKRPRNVRRVDKG